MINILYNQVWGKILLLEKSCPLKVHHRGYTVLTDGHHRFVFLIVCCLTEAIAMFPYIFKTLWRIKETPITTAKEHMHIYSNHLSNDLLMHHKPLAHDATAIQDDATVLKNSPILRLGPP